MRSGFGSEKKIKRGGAGRSVVVVGCGFVEDGQSERGGGWLWVYEGWPVGAWQCLVVGLLGWGYVFGIVEVGLWFALDEREEKSRRKREMNNNKKKKKGGEK